MAVPNFQSFLLPLLKHCSDQIEHRTSETLEHLASEFKLSEQDLEVKVPSGQQTVFSNRVNWAATYLRKAGLLASLGRGRFKITQRGIDTINQNPNKIDVAYLKEKFPEFEEFHKGTGRTMKKASPDTTEIDTPEETMLIAYDALKRKLADEILQLTKNCTPGFFERLVVELLVKIGYGGSMEDAGEAVGRSGDEGIDGVIKEDKLGLDIIYIQAKRWEGNISRPDVQKFAGALAGKKARKGVFITTSSFTKEAIEFARGLESKIILIDGEKLADLMVDNDIGVSVLASYDIKKVDSDYFEEELF